MEHSARDEHVHTVTIGGVPHEFTDRFGPYFAEDPPADPPAADPPADPPTDPAAGDAPADPPADPERHDDTSQADPPAGDPPADPPAAEVEVPEVPEDLTAVDGEDALRELYAGLEAARTARIEALASEEDVEAVELMTLAQARIVEEIGRRTDEANALAARVDAVRGAEVPALPADRIPTPVAAAARTAAAAAAPAPATQPAPPAPVRTRPRAVMLASIGGPRVAPGGELDYRGLWELVDRHKRQGTPESPAMLATIGGFEQDEDIPEPLSLQNGASRNTMLIDEAVADWRARQRGEDPPPRTAALHGEGARQAAICHPFDVIREQPENFTDEERFSPSFPQRPIGHLGFAYTPGPVLADTAGGAAIWTETDQANVDPTNSATWKSIVDVACASPLEVSAIFVEWGMRYDITTQMSSPERIAALQAALMARRARTKEGRVLRLADATMGEYVWPPSGELAFGALTEFIHMLNTLLPQMYYFNRQAETGYTVAIPPGFAEVLTMDQSARSFGPDFVPDVLNEIKNNVEGVNNVIELLDGTDAGAGEPSLPFAAPHGPSSGQSAVPTLDGAYRVRIYDPSSYIYGETGEMNVGTYRGPNEVRQNKAIVFGEEGFLLAKHGPQVAELVDISVCATGQRGAILDPVSCHPTS